MIRELFVLSLSRQPTAEELNAMHTLVTEAGNYPAVYEDVLWGLLNSTEFAFNH